MFFNKVKQTATNVFNKGTALLKRVPELVAKATVIAGRIARGAGAAAKKIEGLESVYNDEIKGSLSPEAQAQVSKGFKVSRNVNSQVQKGATIAENVGTRVQPLFD